MTGARSISAKPASIASTLRGRTARARSWPSRRKTSVGQSLTPNERPSRRPLPSSMRMWRTCGWRGEGAGDQRLRGAAVAAPRGAELEQGGAGEGVDLLPRRLGLGGAALQGHGARFWPRAAAGADAVGLPGQARTRACDTGLGAGVFALLRIAFERAGDDIGHRLAERIGDAGVLRRDRRGGATARRRLPSRCRQARLLPLAVCSWRRPRCRSSPGQAAFLAEQDAAGSRGYDPAPCRARRAMPRPAPMRPGPRRRSRCVARGLAFDPARGRRLAVLASHPWWLARSLGAYLSQTSGREVHFDRVRIGLDDALTPEVVFDGVRIANAPWADASRPFAVLGRGRVRVRLAALRRPLAGDENDPARRRGPPAAPGGRPPQLAPARSRGPRPGPLLVPGARAARGSR